MRRLRQLSDIQELHKTATLLLVKDFESDRHRWLSLEARHSPGSKKRLCKPVYGGKRSTQAIRLTPTIAFQVQKMGLRIKAYRPQQWG